MQFGKSGIELEKEWFCSPTQPQPVIDSNRLWWNWYFYTITKEGKKNWDEHFKVIIWEYPEDFENKYLLLEDIDNAFHSISILLRVYEKTGYKCIDSDDLIWNRNINGRQYSQEEFDNLVYGDKQ